MKASIVTFSGVVENKKEIEESLPDGVEFATKEEAIETDNKIIAEETGFPVEVVTKAMLFQESFGKYVDKLFLKYPNQITTTYLEGDFDELKGYVQFVKEVPQELSLVIKQLGQGNKIILTGGGGISIEDNRKRAELVAKSLIGLGYKNIAAYYDPKKNNIYAEVKIFNPTKEPIKNNLYSMIRTNAKKDNLSDKIASFDESDIKLTITVGSEPIFNLDKTRGGSRIYNSNNTNSRCTSGWSIIVPGAGLRVMTAGHCLLTGKNRIIRHSSSGGTISAYSMTNPHNAIYGGWSRDVGYYHTPTAGEEYRFWARVNEVRYTWGTKSTNSMVAGSYVCVFGRSSNIRTCNHQVVSKHGLYGISGFLVNSIVKVTGDSSIAGDSGGGWSTYGTAWGTQSGSNGTHSYFTSIEEGLEAFSAELF